MNVWNLSVGVVLLLLTMNVTAEESRYSGLILMPGDGLRVFDMASNQEVHHRIMNGNEYFLDGISKIDDTHLLVSFSDADSAGANWIYRLDLKSWKVAKLVKGRRPMALKGGNSFFFIAENDEDGLPYLYLASMDANPIAVTQIYQIDRNRLGFGYPLVQVSKGKAIASGPKGHSLEAYEIDINTLKYSPSPIGRCIPRVWFESGEQLLCGKGDLEYEQVFMFFRRQVSETTYFLTSLDGKELKEWDAEHLSMDRADFDWPLHYIPEMDVLLIRRERTSIGYGGALYAYDMKRKKQTWLLNGYVGPAYTVWVNSSLSDQ